MLASAGHHVLIADQRTFPRDKVCGDGLISDSLHALGALGVEAEVTREAWRGRELRVSRAEPSVHVRLRGDFACLPRERLDDILLTAARRAGADFRQATAVSPLLDGPRVAGAQFRTPGSPLEVRASVTVLAVGANPTVLDAFGLAGPKRPDAVAGRAYYEATPDAARAIDHLVIAYDREWCPGYGWIFPSPERRFNIGVGLFGAAAATWLASVLRRVLPDVSAGCRTDRRVDVHPSIPRGADSQRAAAAVGRTTGPARRRRSHGHDLLRHRRRHRQGDGERDPCRGDGR